MNEVMDNVKVDLVTSMKDLLEQFQEIDFKDIKDPTFLELINKGRNENAWSDILRFYLDPKREHGLRDLFIKSLCGLLGESRTVANHQSVRVDREMPTDNRKRLDIVIQSDDFVIGIENKVDHNCDNPFYEYGKMIDNLSGMKPRHKVILSISNCPESYGFKNIRYEQLVSKIEANLFEYESEANPRYLMFVRDFLRNIKNVQKSMHMLENVKAIDFFKKNGKELENLSVRYNEFKQMADNRFREFHQAVLNNEVIDETRVKYPENVTMEITCIDLEDDNALTFYVPMLIHGKEIGVIVYQDDCKDIFAYASNWVNGKEAKALSYEFPGLKIEDDLKENARKLIAFLKEVIAGEVVLSK